jgi:hypothetical protein
MYEGARTNTHMWNEDWYFLNVKPILLFWAIRLNCPLLPFVHGPHCEATDDKKTSNKISLEQWTSLEAILGQ